VQLGLDRTNGIHDSLATNSANTSRLSGDGRDARALASSGDAGRPNSEVLLFPIGIGPLHVADDPGLGPSGQTQPRHSRALLVYQPNPKPIPKRGPHHPRRR
jgi:hypothetical protein